MKYTLILSLAVVLMVFISSTIKPSNHFTKVDPFQKDSIDAINQKYLSLFKEKIKGRESEPSSEVYSNVTQFGKVPAGRLLAIMQMGYSRSLGVSCLHCHNPEDFSSDEKPAKKVAREMRNMANTINSELLPVIGGIQSEKPVVNCTTCHRGQVKPATNLDK